MTEKTENLSDLRAPIDWRHVASAISCFADFFVDTLRAWQAANQMRAAEVEMRAVHSEEEQAAALLGVTVNASPDDVRAALRSKLGGAALHPDQGGDGEEATRLIAAKNLLMERARTIGFAQ